MKDKLMELLNEMKNTRCEIENQIKQQTLNKTIKGLYVISSCLEYGDEIVKYFEKMGYEECAITKSNGTSQFLIKDKKCVISIQNFWHDYEKFSNSIFELYEIEHIAEDENFKWLNIAARTMIETGYTLEHFKEEVNDYLIKIIINYNKKNEEMKKSLSE